tara:strand:- start:519 stop:740 length:222 start_codon:yes stop_codon:yes gene_type:complete
MIEVTDNEMHTRKVTIPKEYLIEALQKTIESLKVPKVLGDMTSVDVQCWNANGTKVCSDIDKIVIFVTRERVI